MRQQSLAELLDAREPDVCVPEGLEVYDLFCGAGGFSCGAELAGCRVVFACDSCNDAIETHKNNHPNATHLCSTLPADLPLPTDGRPFHLHGSPPCQQFSNGNSTGRTVAGHAAALDMIEWYIEIALESRASSWSMEQVSTNGVVKIVERIRKRHPKKLAYHVFDFEELGVPQTRKRLIAGTPALVARLVRLCGTHRVRSVRDVISTGRATHLRNSKGWDCRTLRHIRKPGESKYVYERRPLVPESQRVRLVTLPAPTLLCNGDMRWAWWDTDGVVRLQHLCVSHAAALQTFPPSYAWPKKVKRAYKQIGNALPPLVAELLLRGERGRPRSLAYPLVPLE
jgi:DNA (cytosine-5)-methyltransferase 1